MCIRDRRKRRARMKISEQKRLSGQVSEAKADICPPEIEIKKEIDIEIENCLLYTSHKGQAGR